MLNVKKRPPRKAASNVVKEAAADPAGIASHPEA
jgi:hypothetical protein